MITGQATVDLIATQELLDELLARSANPLARAEGALTEALHQFFQDQFESEGRAGGTPWAPLAARTLLQKDAFGGSRGILRRTDALWSSLVQNTEFSFREVTPTSLELGTRDPIAIHHQDGTRRGLPVRKLAPETVPDVYTDRWANLVMEAILA